MSGLRVIAGSARGRSLKMPHESLRVRPILARIKKSLFDILMKRLDGSNFLDLFSGSGSVGLEAVSRGVKRAVLVEKEKRCAKVIEENVGILGFGSQVKVVNSSVELYLEGAYEKFDIIFMGPPYKNETGMLYLSMHVLKTIDSKKLLREAGILIVQHHKREVVTDTDGLKIVRVEKYGDSKLTFYNAKAG
jgi:16S rRNA (guanine966-N2)-methyltransferase